MHETAARIAPALWPPDDTEWSVVGTDLHQGTITDAHTGINEAAVALGTPPGGRWPDADPRDAPPRRPPLPGAAGGVRSRGTFDRLRRSLSLRREGVPALVIEVLSQDTREVDLDMAEGKGWTYAAAGVAGVQAGITKRECLHVVRRAPSGGARRPRRPRPPGGCARPRLFPAGVLEGLGYWAACANEPALVGITGAVVVADLGELSYPG